MTWHTCSHCRNDFHEKCDGGAWGNNLEPIVCSCWCSHDYDEMAYDDRDADPEEIDAAEDRYATIFYGEN